MVTIPFLLNINWGLFFSESWVRNIKKFCGIDDGCGDTDGIGGRELISMFVPSTLISSSFSSSSVQSGALWRVRGYGALRRGGEGDSGYPKSGGSFFWGGGGGAARRTGARGGNFLLMVPANFLFGRSDAFTLNTINKAKNDKNIFIDSPSQRQKTF